LAAEVETRLAEDLKGVAAQPVVVTGLYGGVDWGPTDAWIQTDRPTIVICTFEKADALLRYLGVLFLHRVRLLIIDEAHMVEQDQARLAGLEDGTSRSFRLEQLGTRLMRARESYGFRVLALSAVAARAAPALARWISAAPDAEPTTSSYRSTRQMLGRLEVSAAGQYTIRYELMDGRSLRFDDERRGETPYVRNPFPPLPAPVDAALGPEVRMRAPTLWAALQLAAQRPDGSTPSVLISLAQGVDAFASTCADLMDAWPPGSLPHFESVDTADELWTRCLASAADYFSVASIEYRLLERGIALHHGKMPGLLARRLKAVIDRGYVRVIIATSTLSEGVNIPVNFLLIPSVYRGTSLFSLQEFSNLIGRAGRPGVATEGSALVVLPERATQVRYGRRQLVPNRQWNGYNELISQIEATAATAGEGVDQASSPLEHLLRALETAWRNLTGGGTSGDFTNWLEQTAVVGGPDNTEVAYQYLDSLDSFLIAAIQEAEELQNADLTPDRIEAELTAIWRRTYAFAAAREEARLASAWLARGRTIKTHYSNGAHRRRIYKTSLTPRSATSLLDRAETIRARLQDGTAYARWPTEERFSFIRDVLQLLSQVPAFQIATQLGRRRNFQDWPRLLRWWLAKTTLTVQPSPTEITMWYDFVAQNFIYRGAWGLGSIIGLLLDGEDDVEPIGALEIADWPRSGLPWIAFWIKELITWGTLDPVAAFLLARGDAIDRPRAEAATHGYYESQPLNLDSNDLLDPRLIREWVEAHRIRPEQSVAVREFSLDVALARPAADFRSPRLTVSPLDDESGLIWIDPAGYEVARSARPASWPQHPASFNFELVVSQATIVGEAYLRHL
jgi:hypothetical protein